MRKAFALAIASACLVASLAAEAGDPPKPTAKPDARYAKPFQAPIRKCLPDLIPLSLTLTDSPPGKTLMTLVLKNQGCGEAGPVHQVVSVGLGQCYLVPCPDCLQLPNVDCPWGPSTFDVFPPGSTKTFTRHILHSLSWVRGSGTWYVQVDPNNEVVESNEANNKASYPNK